MTTIEVTSSELSDIVRILKIKANEDREHSILLTKGLLGVPFNDTHPNRALAQAFLDQAASIQALAEILEDMKAVIPLEKIEAGAQALHKGMSGFNNDVTDMSSYDWSELASGRGWLGEGQQKFRRLTKLVIEATS